MAYYPECKGEMPATAIQCPHCDYDFPPDDSASSSSRNGFAYSPLADLALLVSTIAAVIGACSTTIVTIVSIIQAD